MSDEPVWRTPNEVYEAACRMELGGRTPTSEDDWVHVIEFFSANISVNVQPEAIYLMCVLYECPHSRERITEILRNYWGQIVATAMFRKEHRS